MKKTALVFSLLASSQMCLANNVLYQPKDENAPSLESIIMSYGTPMRKKLELNGATSGLPKTAFSGATMKLNIVGGVAPYSVEVTEGNVVVEESVVTIKDKGNIKLLISDSDGASFSYAFNPKFFSKPDNLIRTFSQSEQYCRNMGGSLPKIEDIALFPTARMFGYLFAEWGSFSLNQSGWYTSEQDMSYKLFRNQDEWSSMGYVGHISAYMDNGLVYQTFDDAFVRTTCILQ
ncbi:hypothetical protein GCM10007938_09360 [Vibrio zhanjiangensis]|uniref:DUF1566 domain-containing protein n=1 Tax=Vibrio zhanjiangensis TaxID=1046128 RepID=A0ABQ6EVW9_9VIBR|nr:hypothetical protein [Vibrio zhanjiangensis]GLT17159.1 hypothetical protein GCM10007938_09360 [Vibrio zhanjiangensis]